MIREIFLKKIGDLLDICWTHAFKLINNNPSIDFD